MIPERPGDGDSAVVRLQAFSMMRYANDSWLKGTKCIGILSFRNYNDLARLQPAKVGHWHDERFFLRLCQGCRRWRIWTGAPRKKWASAQEQQQLLSQTRAVVVTSTALKLLSDVVGERRSIVALTDCQRLSLQVVRCFFCPSE